ncbi:hypothetical protein Tco_0265010 [Tanacetum coccineum]
MTIPTLLMLFESHALSIKTPVKNLRKNLHKSTIIVVMSVVIHLMEFFVDNAYVNLVAKIDPILEEFADELAHIAPIPSGIVEADFDPNDDTSSDDDDFEDIEYVSLEEVNDVDQDEKEFNLEDIFQIQDVILREKLLNVSRLISNIESLKDNPIPIMDSDSSETSLSFSDNSLPEFESFSDHTEETRSGSTTTHANYSLPEFESFHFDPSFPRPPPEPPDVEILEPENNNFDVLNNDEYFDPREGENVVFLNVEEDDSFTFTICTFLPFVTYPERTTGYEKIQRNDLWLLSMFEDRHHNRDLDRTTLRELIDSEDSLIPDIPVDDVQRVAAQRAPRVQRASMQDLYERMGSMEIRQEAIERMKYRQSYHWDRYQGVFEHMTGVYSVPLQGAYNPPSYAQP